MIAGGGIYTGADIRRFIELGASGVQMATRFVATDECDADPAFKATYLAAGQSDLEIIKSPVGMPGRAIRNKFLDDVAEGRKKPFACPYHCIVTCDVEKSPYCISLALMNAQKGRLDKGFAFAGANAWRTEKIVPVRELVEELVQGNSRLADPALPRAQRAALARGGSYAQPRGHCRGAFHVGAALRQVGT